MCLCRQAVNNILPVIDSSLKWHGLKFDKTDELTASWNETKAKEVIFPISEIS